MVAVPCSAEAVVEDEGLLLLLRSWPLVDLAVESTARRFSLRAQLPCRTLLLLFAWRPVGVIKAAAEDADTMVRVVVVLTLTNLMARMY